MSHVLVKATGLSREITIRKKVSIHLVRAELVLLAVAAQILGKTELT